MTQVQYRLANNPLPGKTLLLPWIVCSILAISLLVYMTRWGIGTSPDSAAYLGIASNLLAGKGLTVPYGQHADAVTAHFPPLYPIFLALGRIFHEDLIIATRWLHISLFTANLLIAGFLYRRLVSKANWLPGLALLPLAVSGTMLRLHYMAWSEALFLFFGFLSILLTLRGISGRNIWWLAAGGIAAGAATLTRYAGATFVVTIGLGVLIFSIGTFRRRITNALFSVFPSVILLISWFILSGVAGGRQQVRVVSFHLPGMQTIQQAVDTMSGWLLIPGQTPGIIKSLVLVIFFLVLVLLAIIFRSRRLATQSTGASFLAIFVLIYPLFLLLTVTFLDANLPLDARILSPVLVAGVGLVVYSLGLALNAKFTSRLPSTGILVFCALLHSSITVIGKLDLIRDAHDYGIGFTRKQWQESQLISIVGQVSDEILIYTNTAEGIYLNTGKSARPLPRKINPMVGKENSAFPYELTDVYQQVKNGSAVIAYFYSVNSPALLTRDEVHGFINGLSYIDTPDGLYIGNLVFRDG